MDEKIGYFIGREYADPESQRGFIQDLNLRRELKYPPAYNFIEVYDLVQTKPITIPIKGEDVTRDSISIVGKRIGKMALNGTKPTLEEIPSLIRQTIRLSRKNVIWFEAYEIVNGKPSPKEKVYN